MVLWDALVMDVQLIQALKLNVEKNLNFSQEVYFGCQNLVHLAWKIFLGEEQDLVLVCVLDQKIFVIR